MSKDTQKQLQEFAIQQLTGYQAGWTGEPVSSLVSSMALSEEEWKAIKPECQWLDKKLIEEIDEYFEGENE